MSRRGDESRGRPPLQVVRDEMDGFVGPNWVHWPKLAAPQPRPVLTEAQRAQAVQAELAAALEGEAAKRQAFLDGVVTRCEHCGRTDGLKAPMVGAVYTIVICDCNYVHFRDTPRWRKAHL